MMDPLLSKLDVETLLTRAIAFLPNLVAAIVVAALFWLLFRLSRNPIELVLRRTGFAEPLVRLLVDNIYRFALLIFGLVMAADQLGINVGAALAGIGIAGIAVGFAAQDSLANTIAGFTIFWDKPFGVGDWVRVAGEYGSVTDITIRTTRIRTLNNTYVVIPNKKVIDEVLVNHSKHGETRVDVPIGIAYKEFIPRAREVVLEAVRGVDGVDRKPEPEIVVTQMGASSIDMEVRVWIDDASREIPVFHRVMEASKLALDAAGIEIPYHHMQLFIEKIEDRVWEKLGTVLPGPGADRAADAGGAPGA
ncbi:MAG: mechanosensitive ion channel [Candidatus Eisenbacteria bacterium]|nr:mechanosensitive ion channel [Candidatus Latescibacterota bacterium]MBD3303489.1 mechanosensitive ion channel [Candidatus Eisenbacteria bacterium]